MPDDKPAPDSQPQPGQPAPPPAQPEAAAPEGARLLLLNLSRLREFVTFLIVVGVVAFFHFKTLPHQPTDPTPSIFLSSSNIKAMLVGISSEAILVVGMVIVIVGGP